MSGIYSFLKTTLLGGVAVLLPLIAVGAMVVWTLELAIKALLPIFQWLPDKSVGGVSLTVMSASAALLGGCFLIGLLAETAIIRGMGTRAERLATYIPGYTLMKSVGANIIGLEGEQTVRTVLVRFEASDQLGFLMSTLNDGRHVVFVPGVPRAMVGTLHILAPDRVQPVRMSVSVALDALNSLGSGLKTLESMEPIVPR